MGKGGGHKETPGRYTQKKFISGNLNLDVCFKLKVPFLFNRKHSS